MPAGLTRATIVDAAFAVLDESGIDGVTVRALASRLGVKAPALYWHVDSKQALLDEMGTEIARRIAQSLAALPADATLSDALRANATAMRAEYLRHRDGARTFSGTRLTDPEILRRQEAWLATWAAQGIPPQRVTDAFEVVNAFVVGFVIEEQEQANPDRYDIDQRDAAVGSDHPLTIESGHHRFRPADVRFAEHLARLIPALTAG